MKRVHISLLLLLSAATLVLSGCFTSKMNIIVNADGSGSIEVDFSMNKEQMKAFAQLNGETVEDDELKSDTTFPESALREHAVNFGDDVTFQSIRYYPDEETNFGYQAVYHFSDINNLNFNVLTNIPDIQDELNMGKTASFNLTHPDNTSQLEIFPNFAYGKKNKDRAGMQEDIESEMAELHPMLAPFMKGMEIAISIEFAEPVQSTNALFSTDNYVTLMNYRAGEEEISVKNLTTILSYIDNQTSVSLAELSAAGVNIDPQQKISVTF